MPRILWESWPKLGQRLLELDFQGLSHQEIARTLNQDFPNLGVTFSEDMVRNRLKRVSRVDMAEFPETVMTPYFNKYASVITGESPAPEKLEVPPFKEGLARILYFGDQHIPFQCDAAIEAAVQSNLSVDLVVLGGDLIDCYSLSKFEKHASVPFELEVEGALRHFAYLEKCLPGTPVLALSGNHDKRIKRNVQYPMALSFLYDQDFYEAIARPFPNIIPVNNWYAQVADVLFAHDEHGSAVDVRSALTAYAYFREMEEVLGLDPFRLVIQAHTHQAGVAYRNDRKVLEAGCTCVPMAYALSSSKYKRPQVNGWVTLTLQDGRAVLNECREHVWFPPTPLKAVAA